MMEKNAKIYVAGHRGMVGSAIVRELKRQGYAAGLDGLPKSDVLKFLLEDNCSIVIRPSGTEPKLKMYISVSAEDKETAEKTEEEICRSAEEYLNVPKMDIRNPR